MQPILILTKNLLVEQRLQEQLQQLNYEVLCSVQVLKRLRKDNQALKHFQVIIFSETVTNQEITNVLTCALNENKIFFRKFSVAPSTEEQEQLRALGLTEWLAENTSVDHLRERLAETMDHLQKAEQEKVISLNQSSAVTQKLLEHFLNTLTKKEKKAFQCLQEANGEIVSREYLCQHMWGEALCHSRMSQMSVLVKNIKYKLKEAGFNDQILRTIWGSGYCLTPEFSLEIVEKVE